MVMKKISLSSFGLIPLLVLACGGSAIAQDFVKLEDIQQALEKSSGYVAGHDGNPLKFVESAVVQGATNAERRLSVEKLLLEALGCATTREAKGFICRQLRTIGTPRAVPALAALLTDPESSHMARYALERIEDDAAPAALQGALSRTSGELQAGIINTLAERRYAPALPDLVKLLGSRDATIALASARALGRIGGSNAANALTGTRAGAIPSLQQAIDNALIHCAERFASAGKASEATDIYELFYRGEFPTHFRIAGLRGLVKLGGERAAPLLVEAVKKADPGMRASAIWMITEAKGSTPTKTFVELLPTLNADTQVEMLRALTARGDRAASAAVAGLTRSSHEPVRVTALEALRSLGDASSIAILAAAAAGENRAEQSAARASLTLLPGDDINDAIVKQLASSPPPIQTELLKALAARGAGETAGNVLKLTDNPTLRKAALATLREIAGADMVSPLLQRLVKTASKGTIAEFEKTVMAAAKADADGGASAEAGLTVLRQAKTATAKAAVLRILGKIGHASALPSLEAGVKDGNEEVRDAAIRSLAGWRDGKPAKTLRAIAVTQAFSASHRVIAFRGYVEQIALHDDVDDATILSMYRQALDTAWRAEEGRLVLSKLSGIRHPGALELVKTATAKPELKGAAEAAAKQIEKLLAAPALVTASVNSGNAKNAIDGHPGSRWDTGGSMKGGEWFKVDLGHPQKVTGLVLDTRGSNGDYPRGYEVYVSPNMVGRGKLAAKGEGNGPVTEIKLDSPLPARVITIVQTGRAGGLFWSIHELTVKKD
jgi:HEAT repeat protein